MRRSTGPIFPSPALVLEGEIPMRGPRNRRESEQNREKRKEMALREKGKRSPGLIPAGNHGPLPRYAKIRFYPPPPPAVPPQSARAVPRGTIQSQPSDEGRSTVQIWYRPLSRTVKTLISHSKYLRIDNRPGPLFVFLIFLHTPYAVERVANVRIPVRSRYL